MTRRSYSPTLLTDVLRLQGEGQPRRKIAKDLDIPLAQVHKFLRGSTISPEQRRINRGAAQQKDYLLGTTEKIIELRRAGTKLSEIPNLVPGVDINKVLSDLRYNKVRLAQEQRATNHEKYPKEVRKLAIQMRRDGKSLAEISAAVEVPEGAVQRWCLREGVKTTHEQRGEFRRDQELENDLEVLRREGVPRGEIGLMTGASMGKIKDFIRHQELQLSSEVEAEWRHGRHHPKAYAVLTAEGLGSFDERMHVFAEQRGGKFLGTYSSVREKTQWQCGKGHDFEMLPNCVQQGQWCPRCVLWGAPSAGQVQVYEFIRSLAPDAILDERKAIAPKEIDAYVPSTSWGLEYHGLFWHSSGAPKFKRGATADKVRMCWAAGVDLFVLFEDEWREKREIVEGMIRFRLGKFAQGQKLDARKLQMEQVEGGAVTEFLNRNHLDGSTAASHARVLTADGKIVAVASFRRRFNEPRLEVARFAVDRDVMVRGAAGRLLKAEPGPLMSYSNNRFSRGGVYEKLGWKEATQTTAPNYWYTDSKVRFGRLRCKRVNDPVVLAEFPTEEAQAVGGVFGQMLLGKPVPLHRIEDAGNRRWERD